ncbi:LPS export ABC transporter permease LptG [Yunchengibacter salinarum]|uniref:LPS export ABC transporter permease LptG n=1 Tax=Yunchengibacter salinarum TaxID=3133399 RepID=UPI0035B5BF11
MTAAPASRPISTLRALRRRFLPSRTLSTYMARMHLTRFFGVLLGLTMVLQILDLLAQSDDILSAEGASYASIISYVSLRLPQLISQFAPFVALLATLLTLATLNQHSEVIVMKATGLSAHRILSPIGLASLMIAGAHFAFNELIVADASRELDYWAKNDYAVDLPPPTELGGQVWLKDGEKLVRVGRVSRVHDRIVLDRVAIFKREGTSRLVELARADFAWYRDGRWTLHEVRRFDTQSHALSIQPTEPVDLNVSPGRFTLLDIKPDHLPFASLWSKIEQRREEGLATDRLMASFLQKIAGPAASILMPLLGAVAAFGIHRGGSLFLRLVLGMALGFTFFVADNFMLAMGEFGVAPPILAAWAPFLLFLLVGYAVLFYSEEGQVGTKLARWRSRRRRG